MGLKGFVFGLLVAISISACGSLRNFLFKFYVFNFESGILQGPREQDDLPINVCARTQNEYQCIVMKIDEFYRLKTEYEKRGQRIEELERNCGRNN